MNGATSEMPMRRQKDRAKAASTRATQQDAVPSSPVSQAEIARRAYEIYQARGGRDGQDLEDWLAAERELADSRSNAEKSAVAPSRPRERQA